MVPKSIPTHLVIILSIDVHVHINIIKFVLFLNDCAKFFRLFNESNEETANITNVAWIDTSVSAKPILCRIREAMSRLAYLSFLIGFGKYSDVFTQVRTG